MTNPIRCWNFENAYDTQYNGPCCYQSIPGVSSFKQMHESPIYKEIQESFQQGAWPENYCTKCRDLEATYPDQRYSKRLANINNLQLYNNHHGKLMDLVIDTGRLCNLQCRSCKPQLSSSWIAEAEELANNSNKLKITPYLWIYDYNSPGTLSNVWPSNQYDLQDDDFSNLIYVNFQGGEPLYNVASINQYLEKILRDAGPNCEIFLSTNGTVSYKTVPLLKEFKKVGLSFSLDATGLASDFIRTGSNWEVIKNNVLECKEIGFVVAAHPAFSVMNIFSIVELRKFIQEHGIYESKEIAFVKYPSFLSYDVLTNEEKVIAMDYLEKNDLRFLKDQIEASAYNSESRERFFEFMEHTKKYHDMDWKDYLPELYQLMNN